MTAADKDSAPNDTAAEAPVERDMLGNVCFYLHFAIMIYIVTGWAVPVHGALLFYVGFLPVVILSWWFNRNSCVLNNLESYIRTGRWRHASNPEEGAWLLTLARNVLGIVVTPRQMDIFTYSVMFLVWGLGLWHLRGF